jgi:hypothetical protein
MKIEDLDNLKKIDIKVFLWQIKNLHQHKLEL